MKTFSAAILLIFLTPPAALAAGPLQCAHVLTEPLPTLQTDTRAASRWLDLFSGPLARRYATDPFVQKLQQDFLSLADSQALEFYGEGITGSFQKTRKNLVLTFHIPRLVLKHEGRSLELGQRPQGLNLEFTKVIFALSKAAQQEAARDPHIQFIQMEAGSVVNPALVSLLKESGFVKKPQPILFNRGHLLPMDAPLHRSRWSSPLPEAPQTWSLSLKVLRDL